MRRPFSKAGMAGLIVSVMVLSILMVVLTSGVLLVRTETQAVAAGKFPNQARVAAMSGLQFYLGTLVVASATTFHTDPRQRLHFLSQANRNVTIVAGQQVATWTGGTPSYTYSNIATSSWMYPTAPLLFNANCPDIPSSTLFIIKTYAHEDNGVQLASYVYVKSLGCFREIQGNDVIASHYFQLIARIRIDKNEGELALEKMKTMPVQFPAYATSSFHTVLPLPW